MFEGGCHCGRIRFEVETEARVLLECDCSMCSKKGNLHLIVEAEQFRLLRGQGSLSEYHFGTGVAKHLFCSHCGIHPYYVPRSHPEGFSVNFRCLDNYQELRAEFTIEPFAGSRWEENIHSIR